MNEKPAARLRELARRYADGQVSRSDYLALRTALLDAATGVPEQSGGEQSVLRDAPAEGRRDQTSDQDATLPDLADRAQAAGDAGQPPPGQAYPAKYRLLVRTGLSGAATAIVVGVLWFALPGPQQDAELPATPETHSTEADQGAGPSAEELVAEFLSRDDWGAGATGDFLVAWEQLPAVQRREALGAAWFKALTDELSERITEQQALAEIRGPLQGSGEHSALVEFAERLGLR